MNVEVGARWGGHSGGTPGEDDARALRSLLHEAEQVDGTPPISDQAVTAALRGERELLRFDISHEADTGATAADTAAPDTPAAKTAERAQLPAAVAVIGDGEVDLVVRPDLRRQGIGTRALAEVLTGRHDALRAWAHGENPTGRRLLDDAGFTPVRELLRMTLDPALLPAAVSDPVAPRTLPGGFHVVPYDPQDGDQATEWVRINAAAFASHPEQGKITVDDFLSLTREAWFDPADLFLCFVADGGSGSDAQGGNGSDAGSGSDAKDGNGSIAGQGAAYAWIKTLTDQVTGEGTSCELYALGVHPDAAGNRLGSTLLSMVFSRMAQHRPSRVVLYVDGDNTRAVDLYEKNGFTIEQRSVQWLREASEAPADRD